MESNDTSGDRNREGKHTGKKGSLDQATCNRDTIDNHADMAAI